MNEEKKGNASLRKIAIFLFIASFFIGYAFAMKKTFGVFSLPALEVVLGNSMVTGGLAAQAIGAALFFPLLIVAPMALIKAGRKNGRLWIGSIVGSVLALLSMAAVLAK